MGLVRCISRWFSGSGLRFCGLIWGRRWWWKGGFQPGFWLRHGGGVFGAVLGGGLGCLGGGRKRAVSE